MTRRRAPVEPSLADLQQVWRDVPCTCEGDVFVAEDHEDECLQAQAIRRLHGVDYGKVNTAGRWRPEGGEAPTLGMTDITRLMGVAATAQAALANVDLDSLTPEQLYARFCDAAGGEANLRDLMNGAPLSARQIAPMISGAQAPAEPETPLTPQPRRVNTVDFYRAITEANRRAEERERPQGDAPAVDLSNLTAGEWVRVREDANIIAFHLKGRSGRVCENQHTIHQSMADPERWVTLWFPCDPETTHRIRKTALIGRGNIPDCTCNDIGHSPLHEAQCETAIFNSGVYIDGDRPDDDVPKPPSPPPPRRRKWGG